MLGAAMAKLARLPRMDSVSEAEIGARRVPRLRTRYYAFLSYSHKDKELAEWLHGELEKFRVPSSLAGKLTANGVVPMNCTVRRYCVSGSHCRLTSRVLTSKSTCVVPTAGVPA